MDAVTLLVQWVLATVLGKAQGYPGPHCHCLPGLGLGCSPDHGSGHLQANLWNDDGKEEECLDQSQSQTSQEHPDDQEESGSHHRQVR